MAVTIKDVARAAGLSIATVSKYMNGGHVLESNRAAIELAIASLGYRVNVVARGLKTRRTMTVGVLIPSIEQIFSTEIIAAVEKKLSEAGFSTIVCDCQLDAELESRKMEILLEKQVDGIITMPFSGSAEPIQKAIDQGVPVVLIDRKVEGLSLDTVLVDNENLAYQAVSRLIEAGHRRIGIVLGPETLYTSQRRLAGYLAAMQTHGIPVDPGLIHPSDYQIAGGQAAFLALLERSDRPTAIFTTNYETTFAAGLMINEKGLAIPQDLSWIGFDSLSMAQIFKPRLTIVVQPIRQIGETAAQLILERVANGLELAAREIILPGAMIEGLSTRSIRKYAD
ncbi:MAG: LacI family transcriptional regulator [Clostridia bacterium]|nr:LacI family transcriptional regulator [Clostridia bacterium]